MSKAILSDKYPQFAEKLRSLGYQVIPSERVSRFLPYEQDHADMQCLILDDTAFVLSCCHRLAENLSCDYHVELCGFHIDGGYPSNVCLNAAVLGKRLICRIPSLDQKVKDYCETYGYELIHVNQGYAKCSCAVIGDNALITADKGIYHSLKESKIDILLIEEGRVRLDGADYGFIGGASGYDKKTKTLYFCGDIDRHPDHENIRRFCDRHNTKIVSLTDDILTDVGGILFC
ncbi:MAG: hypothetical protein IJV48_04905 [Ruminococcus sp.]|nr:hypothetical protein [Ruminococcus sp.]